MKAIFKEAYDFCKEESVIYALYLGVRTFVGFIIFISCLPMVIPLTIIIWLTSGAEGEDIVGEAFYTISQICRCIIFAIFYLLCLLFSIVTIPYRIFTSFYRFLKYLGFYKK